MGDHYLYAFKAGGWVMIPLALCSALGWLLVFRIAWKLRHFEKILNGSLPAWWKRRPRPFVRRAGAASPERLNGVHCMDGVGLSLRLLSHASRRSLEAKLDEWQKRWVPELEKGFPALSVLITVAPLLGLFGTVSGIINTFKLMAVFGTDNPALLGTGIREALITTQAGLLIAVPLMLGHILLLTKSDRLEARIEQHGWEFISYGRKGA